MSELTAREHKLAQNLLDAAYAYWDERRKHGSTGSVVWLSDTNGRTIIFTRSEYRSTLMKNIDNVSGPKTFDLLEESK